MIYYESERLFHEDSVSREISIVVFDFSHTPITSVFDIKNSDIVQGSLELKQGICEGDNIIFGSYQASELNFETTKTDFDYLNSGITLYIRPEGAVYYLMIPDAFVCAEEKYSADKKRKILKYYSIAEQLSRIDMSDWYNNLFFPLQLKQFRDSFFLNLRLLKPSPTVAQIPLEQVDTELVNDSMMVTQDMFANGLFASEILQKIGEINGVVGRWRGNEYEYVSLDGYANGLFPADDVFPANNLYPQDPGSGSETYETYEIGENGNYINASFSDYYTKYITGVTLRSSSNDIGRTVGTLDNCYVIEDNFLLYGKSDAELEVIATRLLNKISKISYVPCEIELKGNPCRDVGDAFYIKTRNGTFTSFILQRTLHGSQFLIDNFSAEGLEKYEYNANGYNYEIKKLRGMSNEIVRTVEVNQVTMLNITDNIQSELTQTASSLQSQINDLESEIDGNTGIYEREGIPTMENYPYWDFTTSIPCDGTIRTDDIYDADMEVGGNEFPHFTYTEADRVNHSRDVCVDLSTANAYRFLKSQETNTWYWAEIQGGDMGAIVNRLSTLEQTVDGISTEVTATSVVVTNQGAQIQRNTSNITQQAAEISAKVSKGSIISEINQSPESISINAGKISLNGAVTANNNVVIGQDGKITAKGASLASGAGSQNVSISNGQLTTYNESGKSGIRILDNQIDFYSYFSYQAGSYWVGSINTYSENVDTLGIYASQYLKLALGYTADPSSEGHASMIIGNAQGGAGYYNSPVDVFADEMKIRALHLGGNTSSMATGLLEGYHENDYDYVTLRGKQIYLVMMGNDVLKQSITPNEGQLIGTWYGTLNGSSDERLKKDIQSLSERFIRAIGKVDLKQFVFNYPNETQNTGKIAIGAIAQEVRKALESEGINPDDYDISMSYSDPISGQSYFSLNYNEFLVARNAYLEKRVDELEERISRLERLIKE